LIKYLTPLSTDIVNELINIYNSEEKLELAWRKGASFKNALSVLKEYIDYEFGHSDWQCNEGTFFEAFQPYRIHTDTSTTEHNYQTVVIPLDWEHNNTLLDKNVLYIFKQRWHYEATMFRYGSKPTKEGPRHNTDTREYSKVESLEVNNFIDKETSADCNHLNERHFTGLSVEAKMQWSPGKPFTFPRTALHCSNNWHRLGITSKLGLSLFTSSTKGARL